MRVGSLKLPHHGDITMKTPRPLEVFEALTSLKDKIESAVALEKKPEDYFSGFNPVDDIEKPAARAFLQSIRHSVLRLLLDFSESQEEAKTLLEHQIRAFFKQAFSSDIEEIRAPKDRDDGVLIHHPGGRWPQLVKQIAELAAMHIKQDGGQIPDGLRALVGK